MDRIVLEPASWEQPYQRQYEELVRDLRERGFEVELIVPETYEERGTQVYDLTLFLVTPDLVVHVATHLADHALDILEGALIYHLIGKVKIGPKRGMRRRAPILGPRGEVLREVELPPGDEDEEAEDEDQDED
jgi:hypothetical protein